MGARVAHQRPQRGRDQPRVERVQHAHHSGGGRKRGEVHAPDHGLALCALAVGGSTVQQKVSRRPMVLSFTTGAVSGDLLGKRPVIVSGGATGTGLACGVAMVVMVVVLVIFRNTQRHRCETSCGSGARV